MLRRENILLLDYHRLAQLGQTKCFLMNLLRPFRSYLTMEKGTYLVILIDVLSYKHGEFIHQIYLAVFIPAFSALPWILKENKL